MKNKDYVVGAALGALCTAFAGVGGYWASASAQPGAVNQPTAALASPAAPSSFADIVQRVSPAVVSIDVEGKAATSPIASVGDLPPQFLAPFGDPKGDGPFSFDFRQFFQQRPDSEPAPKMRASGSGFFISADGYIVTNNHVVEHADKITVRTKDNHELKARLIGRDPATDLAVIKVEGADFPYVNFEDRAKPRVGDWVVAVGNPFGLGGTATAGIVSALGRKNVSESSYVDYMQIDAPINRGNSGGPTFDVYGRVVGVNTAIYSPSGGSVGIGFDIPADVAASISHQLINAGKVVRGYIGATVQDVTPEIADSLGLPAAKGALIADLTPDGPSQRAGLKPGDLVMKMNGRDVSSADDLTREVALVRGGGTIRFAIRRDGQMKEIDVRSGVRPSEEQLASNDSGATASSVGSPSILGMRLERNPDGGLTIDGVLKDSSAGEKGLRRGDVIVQANGKPTSAPQDLSTAVAEAKRSGRKDVLLMVMRNGVHSFVPVGVEVAKS